MEDVDEIVQEFLVESHENLDQLDRDLVALEQDPTSRPLLGAVFRTIHTIKGTSGFLALHRLEAVTHAGENMLAKLRDGVLLLDAERTSALLEMVDAVRRILAEVEATGGEGDADHSALVARLDALSAATPAATAPEEAVAELPAQRTAPAEESGEAVGALLGEVLVERGAAGADDVALAVLQQAEGDARPIGEILVAHGAASSRDVDEALEVQAESRRSVSESSIRVDVDLLDSLMRLVGELVLTRNQVVQHASGRDDVEGLRYAQRLNLIVSELQGGVMKTRMQPIDNVWSKLTRVVRDLGVACGKQVRLEMEGRDTELDKTILEAIKDPLTHCVRNCVDHGIETPEERRAAGKPAEGVLLLRAFHEGGQVNIEIVDDGAGIDPERIAAKALERGLVGRDELARMSERELLHLIFLPGFSTAARVTNVSGRGVGMDVVKTNIEKIGGTVDISSVRGRGTTLRLKIPLTLAIIPALTVRTAGERYAIPQVSLVELVRLDNSATEAGRSIERISGAPVLRLRGDLLPLVFLDEQLGLPRPDDAEGSATFIVVLQADDRQFGLVVHEVLDTEEIVVKPLGAQLKHIDAYAGATILGDGGVALILDCLALAQRAHVVRHAVERRSLERREVVVDGGDAVRPLLVARCGEGRRLAIPLDMVTRLEEFGLDVVERVGSREVVQYRGQILPLVRVSRIVGAYDSDPTAERLHVVVYSEGGRSVGLVVDEILDITEEPLAASSDLDDQGLLGSAVVQSRITELLDVREAVAAADPHFHDAAPAPAPRVPEPAGALA
jgi:two-component system, chemotaxis family, sensor kinase CheA